MASALCDCHSKKFNSYNDLIRHYEEQLKKDKQYQDGYSNGFLEGLRAARKVLDDKIDRVNGKW